LPLDQRFFGTWTPRALAALRLVTGYLYLQHGTSKLLHVPHVPMFDHLRLLSLDGFAGMLEICGSLLILLGLFTRPVAFILSGEMAVAYFLVHARQGNVLMPALNQGELAVLYCFIFLFLAAAGGGSWSIDALLDRKRTAKPSLKAS
jgi:putative oxidoreductase